MLRLYIKISSMEHW